MATNPVFYTPMYTDNSSADWRYKGGPFLATVEPKVPVQVTTHADFSGIKSSFRFPCEEHDIVMLGPDFSMNGKEFKICMKLLLEMAKKEMPEEFI